MKSDLNQLKRRYTDVDNMEPYEQNLADFSLEHVEDVQNMSVYFRNIESEIVDKIKQSDVVVGCVAWMTSEAIITELANRKGASIILQKEDFLRPDINEINAHKTKLQELYNSVKDVHIFHFDQEIQVQGKSSLHDADGVRSHFGFRCVGHKKTENDFAMPRMHHKFLVFCKYIEYIDDSAPMASNYEPYAIWTGSYNMTKNATYSLENGVYIESKTVANGYFREWEQLIMVSEPLDWDSEYAKPELEINTLACIS